MKITIKEKSSDVITFNNIKPGMVYEIRCGVTLLKLAGNEAVVLNYSNGQDWLEVASSGKGNFRGEPATKILGKIDEIVVVLTERA